MIRVDLSLMKNVLTLLAKIPLGLTADASTTDAAFEKKTFGSGMIALIISNNEMNDIMKYFNILKNQVYW